MAQETTKLTHQIVTGACTAVDTYKSTITGLNAQLDTLMEGLKGVNNFSGDASGGYYYFYSTVAKPALNENLVGEKGLCVSLTEMMKSIEKQLLDVVDPQMDEVNRDPSGAAQGAADEAQAAASAAQAATVAGGQP